MAAVQQAASVPFRLLLQPDSAAVRCLDMNRAAILAVLVAVLATSGVCYVTFGRAPDARIDGSTEASFKSSLDGVNMSLPAAQRERFEVAMAAHARTALLPEGDGNNPLAGIMALSADKDAPSRRLRGRLDGLTAEQVISTAPISAGVAGSPFDAGRMNARRNVNESAAIATLRNISSAQAEIHASGVIDRNGNGAGEYGWFGEMAGVSDIKLPDGRMVRASPPVISTAFGNVKDGRVTRSGYHFQLFLPGSACQPVADGLPDAGQAEVLWCCYAWPTEHENSGGRAFFINQAGDVLAARNTTARYSGIDSPPQPMAAFLAGQKDIGGMVAANSTGNDGEIWLVVH